MERKIPGKYLYPALSAALIACSPSAPIIETPTPPPARRPESAATPVPTSSPLVVLPTATRTPVIEFTPGPTSLEQHDLDLKKAISQARKNEILSLDNALFRHIIRFPWEGGQAYVATLGIAENGKIAYPAVATSVDCLYNSLRENNQLGNTIIPGIWRPNQRIDRVVVNVTVPQSVATPIVIFNMRDLDYKGKNINCVEETALDRLSDFIGKINWRGIPENTGEFLGWFTKEFAEGIRRGFFSNP